MASPAVTGSMMLSVTADLSAAEMLIPISCPALVDEAGRFELQEVIAITLRSCVYRAFDRRLGTSAKPVPVAVKVGSRPRNSREGVLGRRVQHPNVVEVIDRGMTAGGLPYTVLAWMDGPSLDRVQSPRPPREAAAWVAAVADAVQAVHDAGVLHCDIKPANVFLDAHGVPKLGDFDLAVDRDEASELPGGTLAFMAPEQFRREPGAMSPPTDVYALGALLYYLLTGEPPHGRNTETIVGALGGGSPPQLPRLPAGLGQILCRSVAPSRADRYRTALELHRDLVDWLGHRPIGWQRPSVTRRVLLGVRRHPVRFGLALAAGAVVVAGSIGTVATLAASKQALEAELASQAMEHRRTETRSLIKASLLALTGANGRRAADDALPGLAWLDSIAGRQLQSTAVELEGWPVINALRVALAAAVADKTGESLAALAVRVQIIEGLLSMGEYREAHSEWRRVPAGTRERLTADDPLRLTVEALGSLAALRDPSSTSEERTAARQQLAAIEPRLRKALISRKLTMAVAAALKEGE